MAPTCDDGGGGIIKKHCHAQEIFVKKRSIKPAVLHCNIDNINYLYYIMENNLDHINLINTLKERIKLLEQKNAELTSQLQEKDFNLLYSNQELDKLRRMIFGSKSERFKSDECPLQLSLDFGLHTDKLPETATEKEKEVIEYERNKNKPKATTIHTRQPLPAHLPREVIILEPKGDLSGAVKIGVEITEVLEYRHGYLIVKSYQRNKYAFPREENPIVIADLPTLPIPRSNASASMLAHIIISKFCDHLPFYRQSKMFGRDNIDIPESTMNDWFKGACILLAILYEKLVSLVKMQDYLQADETPIRVQDRSKPGKTHTGYHWCYHSPVAKLVCFDYQKGRGREGPEEFLKDFRGTLQTDGYAGYLSFEKPGKIRLISCLVHIRRKFDESKSNDNERSIYVLERIQEIYAIERECRVMNLEPHEIVKVRKEKCLPIMEELEIWLKDNVQQVLPKSLIGKAINYALEFWEKQKRYVEDGRYLPDNNLIENSIRPVCLGKKNYMFAGNHQGARHAAMIYSFLGTCKKNGVNPREWLTDVLTRLPDCKTSQLEDLLPHKWVKSENKQPYLISEMI